MIKCTEVCQGKVKQRKLRKCEMNPVKKSGKVHWNKVNLGSIRWWKLTVS